MAFQADAGARAAHALRALAAILLLAAPAATAAVAPSPPIGKLTASGLTLDGSLWGPLRGARIADNGRGSTPSLSGTAAWAQVRVEADEWPVAVDGGQGPPIPASQKPTVENRTQATLSTYWTMNQRDVELFPLGSTPPTLTLAGGCLSAKPSDDQAVQPFGHVAAPTGPHPSAKTEGSQLLGSCAPPRMSLDGDVLVMLWEATVQASDATGTTTAWSGIRPEPGPAGSSVPLGSARYQQIFLSLRGAHLDLEWNSPAATSIYVDATQAQATALTLADADGTLPDGAKAQPVHAAKLDLQGHLTAAVAPAGKALAVTLGGTPGSALADGQPLPWSVATVAAADPHAFATGFLFLVVGTVVAPAAGVASHRAWSRRTLAALEAHLAARRLDAVVRRSRALARWSPFRTEALLLRIDALLGQGRAREALAAVGDLPARVRAGPLGPFLRGHVLAAAGQARAAAGPLALAAAQGPEFRARIRADPLYAAARAEPALRAALEAA